MFNSCLWVLEVVSISVKNVAVSPLVAYYGWPICCYCYFLTSNSYNTVLEVVSVCLYATTPVLLVCCHPDLSCWATASSYLAWVHSSLISTLWWWAAVSKAQCHELAVLQASADDKSALAFDVKYSSQMVTMFFEAACSILIGCYYKTST